MAVLAKCRRVLSPDASGYATNWSEGNYYGIRALKQELSRQRPTQQPILLTQHLETELAITASKLFGIEWHRVVLEESEELYDTVSHLTSNGERPIIFAATLANTLGESDDMKVIDHISRKFPLLLHLDACRVFDYLTTASDELRRELGLSRLRLHHSQLDVSGCIVDGELLASTIVAGGSNSYVFPPPVIVLKPRLLGDQSPATVEYVRGTDSTLAGSRDSLGPLMLCLQELRFGHRGLRDIYESCALKRLRLIHELRAMNVSCSAHEASLDLNIDITSASTMKGLTELGAKALGNGKFLLSIQPSVQLEDFMSLLNLLGSFKEDRLSRIAQQIQLPHFTSTHRLPDGVTRKVWNTVQDFKIAARSSCGYPLNQASCSALGPAIGPFLTVKIPEEWSRTEALKILSRRKQAFGLLTPASQGLFGASFTTGSTMGNRIGLHTALAQHPNAFVYFSSASHYSVKKTVSDCDDLTRRWTPGRVPRFTEIPADEYGRISPESLVQQVLSDRAECASHNEVYQLILFANMGTTFVGGRDDLIQIRKQLAKIDAEPSYIHVDGALDLGFLVEGIRLGPPGASCTSDGIPIVQGITLSHHKVFGIMVSGEVIGYCPNALEQFKTVTGSVEPRAVLETWLFELVYLQDDLISVWQYCLENAFVLRRLLADIKVSTHFNDNSIITLLERPPPWLINEFQLAPEGEWVHFLTMPHISPTTVRRFTRAVALVDEHCITASAYVENSLATSLRGCQVRLQRLTCKSHHVNKVLDIAKTTILADPQSENIRHQLGLTQVEQLWTRFVSSVMSFIAVDDRNEPLVIFLAEADSKRLVRPSLILVNSAFSREVYMLQDIAIQLFGHVARVMNVSIETNLWSYKALLYVNNV